MAPRTFSTCSVSATGPRFAAPNRSSAAAMMEVQTRVFVDPLDPACNDSLRASSVKWCSMPVSPGCCRPISGPPKPATTSVCMACLSRVPLPASCSSCAIFSKLRSTTGSRTACCGLPWWRWCWQRPGSFTGVMRCRSGYWHLPPW